MFHNYMCVSCLCLYIAVGSNVFGHTALQLNGQRDVQPQRLTWRTELAVNFTLTKSRTKRRICFTVHNEACSAEM